MEFKLNIDQSKGSAVAIDNSNQIGEMTFSIASEELIIIDHTQVDPSYRGQRIGEQLLEKVVTWARENNVKIMPLCSFAKAKFDRNEDIQDVLKK